MPHATQLSTHPLPAHLPQQQPHAKNFIIICTFCAILKQIHTQPQLLLNYSCNILWVICEYSSDSRVEMNVFTLQLRVNHKQVQQINYVIYFYNVF